MRNEPIYWTESFYDSLGRAIKVKTPDGAEATTSYFGNTVTVTDQSGKKRRSVTNALGQLIRIDEPNDAGLLDVNNAPAQSTNYTYDTLNNLVTVMQGVQTRSFVYDSLSRLKSANNPESGIINYVYDNNSNLTSKTDARSITTNYVYDNLNRVTNRNYTAPANLPNYQITPNVAYTYDNLTNAKGKLIKVANGISTTEYLNFDILGRVQNHKQTTDGNTYNTSYVYNLSGALIEETYPSGRVVRNTLDIDGDLQQVQSKKLNGTLQNYANAFTYTSAGAVSSLRLGNGKFENTTFNSRLQPIQIGLGGSATSQNLLKLNFDYGVTDNNGNVKSQIITTPTIGSVTGFTATQNYTYDSLNRIKQAIEVVTGQPAQDWQQTFVYDRYGNRTFDEANTTTLPKNCGTAPNKVVCAADIAKFNPSANVNDNKLVGTNYDSVGNTKIDANGQVFTYDAENKQVQVSTGSGIVGLYFYDGDGKRVKKIAPLTNETTIFVYDAGGKMVAEYSTVTASQTEAKISYLTNDHLGSPRITTDATGKVISRRDFMPFGEEIARAGNGTDSVRQKFTGYERDGETGLDFAQARMFGSGVGRFTSPDPYNIIFEKEKGRNKREKYKIFSRFIAEPKNWNRYIYVLNNPLKYSDPTGLIFVEANGTIYYYKDKDYNSLGQKGVEGQIGKFKILPTGTVISVNEGASGIFAPYVGKKVVLGDGGALFEITNDDLELGTVRSGFDPETPPMVATDTDRDLSTYNKNIHEESKKVQDVFAQIGDPNPNRFEYYNGGLRHCVGSCLLIRKYDMFGGIGRIGWDLWNERFSGNPDSPSDMGAEDIGDFLSDFNGSCAVLCSNSYPPRPR